MIKTLFMILNMEEGGAQKVLANLVNNMNKELFDITVISIFGGGINRKLLNSDIKYKEVFSKPFKGNSKLFQILSTETLYKYCVKDDYDLVISYLEGSTSRIASGCCNSNTKLVSWIHTEQNRKEACYCFRNYKEAQKCYSAFDEIICVSETIKDNFCNIFDIENPVNVLYNTNESEKIKKLSEDNVSEISNDGGSINLCGIGSLKKIKGFDRLIRIHAHLKEKGFNIHTYLLGSGSEETNLRKLADDLGISNSFTFLGYQTNPYKYISKCDLFVCTSFVEGFSTAATEALILGVPVCTVKVSGMEEMLGKNEFGIITDNDENSLLVALDELLSCPDELAYYKKQAKIRGALFSTERTVKAVENKLLSLYMGGVE